MRVVFMGTPDFSIPVLEQLIESQYQVIAVYTQPDKQAKRGLVPTPSAVKKTALKYGLQVFQPTRLKEPAEIKRMTDLKPDAIVVAAFGQILPQSMLDIPEFGCLNVHPSLLPKYRGASPVASAVLAGDEQTGVTIMLLDAEMDTGATLSQVTIHIDPMDTTGSLTMKLAQEGAMLLLETLPLWFERQLTPQPQDECKASYTNQIYKSDGEINWQLGAIEIWRQVRAFQPWPGCYTWWKGKILKIIDAVPLSRKDISVPGKVVELASPNSIGVDTGDGVLALSVIQLESKRVLSAVNFARGQKGFVGSILGSKY